MNSSSVNIATQVCEAILAKQKEYNIEHAILPSENLIIDRLLDRSIELQDAYEELHGKLSTHHHALETLLEIVLSTTAFWNPQEIQSSRADQKRLLKVNQEIEARACELASLLEERDDLHNTSGFRSDTHYSIFGVIEAASTQNHLYHSYLQTPLSQLSSQFDLKYWPSLSEFVRELSLDADHSDVVANNALTAVATSAARASLADYFKALFVAIEENRRREYGHLPNKLSVSDNTVASLVNCALDLGVDDMVDAQYVKRFRQRERSKNV